MRRRELLTLVRGAAVVRLRTAWAQQAAKLPSIGFLVAGTPASHGKWVAAFVQRPRELGWIEGHTIAIKYPWAEGHTEGLAEIAAKFVRLSLDVFVTSGPPAAIAAKRATSVSAINRTTAEALGLTAPPSLFVRADGVIE